MGGWGVKKVTYFAHPSNPRVYVFARVHVLDGILPKKKVDVVPDFIGAHKIRRCKKLFVKDIR